MKAVKLLSNIGLVIASGLIFTLGVSAQESDAKKREPLVQTKIKKDSTEASKTDEQSRKVQSSDEIKSE